MAEGLSQASCNSILNLMMRGTTWTPPSNSFMQLHNGAPGAAGTSNVTTGSAATRQTITCGTASTTATISASADIVFNVSVADTYSKFSVWTLVSSGVFEFSGAFTTSVTVGNGDVFTVAQPSGFTVSFTPAS